MLTLDDLPQFRWVAALVGRLRSRTTDGHLEPADARKLSSERRRGKWGLRRQAVRNLIHMGHCAPTVMQTLHDHVHVPLSPAGTRVAPFSTRDTDWISRQIPDGSPYSEVCDHRILALPALLTTMACAITFIH